MREVTTEVQFHAGQYGVSPQIHENDFIYQFLIDHPQIGEKAAEHYFKDGRNSAELLAKLVAEETDVDSEAQWSLLEFASGYGCVTRHLRSVVPNATVVACDIHQQAMDLIGRELGVETAISTSSPGGLNLNASFDIVFALSFFSHMPDRTWGSWLEALFRHVRPGGSLIFTTHGELSREKLYSDSFDWSTDGYWFQSASEQHDLAIAEYGTTMTRPDYVLRQIFKLLGVSRVLVDQSFWWGHQDVYVVKKPKTV